MTPQQITHAAGWLKREAERVAVARADLQRQRLLARLRVADQPRDAHGRWVATYADGSNAA